jgi:hypothetical protein
MATTQSKSESAINFYRSLCTAYPTAPEMVLSVGFKPKKCKNRQSCFIQFMEMTFIENCRNQTHTEDEVRVFASANSAIRILLECCIVEDPSNAPPYEARFLKKRIQGDLIIY